MTKLRPFATFLVSGLLLGTLSTGCASEEEEPTPEPTASKAAALTSDVEQAAADPSGEVESGTLPGLMEAYEDFEIATLGGELPAGLDLDLEAAIDGCASGSANAGEVDVSCLSDGEFSGTLRYDIGVDGSTTYVYVEMNQLCDVEMCLDGEAAVKVAADAAGSQQTIAGDLTITQGEQSDELRYGVTLGVSAAGLTTDVVLWHNGDSYVVSTSVGAGGASYTISGANGQWSCDLGGAVEALSGSCTNGADTIDF